MADMAIVFTILRCLVAFCVMHKVISVNKRFLIVSIDNRPLNSNVQSNHYPSITAALNRDYANFHGYGFLQVQQEIQNLVKDVELKYPSHNRIPPTDNAKDAATAFHAGLLQFRAASWAKLPALWHVVTGVGKDYEYIFYIDSDACISSLHRNRSLDDALESWKGNVALGNNNPAEASFIYFNNFPWRDDKPCAGAFICRTKAAESILREWWDFNLPSKNFKHFHEQDALWHMLEHPEYGFKLNFSSVSILKERQFPSDWQRYEELWLCHVASYNYLVRVPILTHMLTKAGIRSDDAFSAAIEKIPVLRVDMFNVSERMEAASLQDPARIKSFPIHNEATQSAWYDANISSRNVKPLAPADLYEGRLIRKRGEFWFVHNGLRRGFPNFNVFLQMGFEAALGFSPKPSDIETIPLGPIFSTNVTENLAYIHSKVIAADSSGCRQHEDLDTLVKTLGSRAIMYLVAHNKESEQVAMKYAACRSSWVNVSNIQSTVFFESIIYRDILPQAKDVWKRFDYVITATYKTLDLKGQTLDEIYRLLKVAKDGNWDIVPFLRSGSGNMGFCLYWHKRAFKDAWDALLTGLGYTVDVIRRFDESKPFFRNVFIVKPSILEGLVEFMAKAIHLALTDTTIANLLSKDSSYKEGNVEVASRIFGTDYYQMHPFIFERLPSFYLHALSATICHDTKGPCQYNT